MFGKPAVVAPTVRIRRTRLDAAREYFDGVKALTTVPLQHQLGDIKQIDGRPAERLALRPRALVRSFVRVSVVAV